MVSLLCRVFARHQEGDTWVSTSFPCMNLSTHQRLFNRNAACPGKPVSAGKLLSSVSALSFSFWEFSLWDEFFGTQQHP